MITSLTIERFKSIRSLRLDCRRVNLFIGEPNVGKSNILEALGLLSWCGAGAGGLGEYVRMKALPDLFHDGLTSEGPIRIDCQGDVPAAVRVVYEKDEAKFLLEDQDAPFISTNHTGVPTRRSKPQPAFQNIRFYRFKELEEFKGTDATTLATPCGNNLFSVVFGSKRLRERVSDVFRTGGRFLVMKPQERTFELQKMVDGVVTAYRYELTSDTLRRIAFYAVAMESNEGKTLVFEEPEAHAFPYYTKQLGEEIALDSANQYFIATHNPYLLTAVVEKAKADDVHVSIVYFRDYETRVKTLNPSQLAEMLGGDPFFMSQRFVEEEGA